MFTLFDRLWLPLFDADEGGGGGNPKEGGATPPEPKADDPKPPWGSDDEYNPEKAWKLIQDVRSDAANAKQDRDAYKSKVIQFEDANKDEKTKLTEAKEEAAKEAAESKAEAIRLRMALKYGLDEDDLDLLGVGDEEQIESRAKRLAERSVSKEQDSSRRPKEKLRPGAAPKSEDDLPSNPDELAARVSSGRGW